MSQKTPPKPFQVFLSPCFEHTDRNTSLQQRLAKLLFLFIAWHYHQLLTKSQKVRNTPVLGMPDIKFSSLFFPLPPSCNEDIPGIILSPLMPSDSQV